MPSGANPMFDAFTPWRRGAVVIASACEKEDPGSNPVKGKRENKTVLVYV
jgi:hypothetical protein